MLSMEKDLVYAASANVGAFTAAVWDVRTRRVPNPLVLTAFSTGMVLHLILDGWPGAAWALLAGLIAGAIFFVFFCAGGLGGGDVKLIAAVASLYGFAHVASLLILTSLAGGVMAVALALWHGRFKETVGNIGAITAHHCHAGLTAHPSLHVRNASSLRLPYGVAIAAGCVLAAMGRA